MPTAETPGHELLRSALSQLDRAAKALNLDPGMHRFLQQPERTLIVALPVTMDDDRLEVFTGYRVQHSTGRGPGKGGIRFHPSVTLEGPEPCDAHDVQVRGDRSPARWGEGRRRGRPAPSLAERGAAPDQALHRRDPSHHRPGAGHSR